MFTKGKWECKKGGDGVSFEIFTGDAWIAHVYMGHGMRDINTVEANARLIAAAPDLLTALKGDEENCTPNAPSILAQALLGNYEAVKSMLSELCSINAKAIAKAEKS